MSWAYWAPKSTTRTGGGVLMTVSLPRPTGGRSGGVASCQPSTAAGMGRQMTDARRWLLAWLALAPVAAVPAGRLADSDPWWQIRTGHLIWDAGRLPTTDPFSWTAAGRPWVLNSWAYDVLLAGVHHLGGL